MGLRCAAGTAPTLTLQQQRYLLAAGTTGLHLGGSLLMTLLGLQTVALALASRP